MLSTAIASEVAIWARIFDAEENEWSPAAASALLTLRFGARDLDLMNQLARKNREGTLTEAERQELESYVRVGDVLSLLQLKARKALRH